MYILIISRGYPSEKFKMNGIFEFDQAKALAQAGHKVIYVAIDMRSFRRKRKWGYESLKKEGVQVEAINIPCGRIPDLMLEKIRILALRKLYCRVESKFGKPDIIHAHFLSIGYIVARVLEKENIPIVLTEHLSAMNQREICTYLTSLGNYTYSKMDKVITVSSTLSKNIKEKFDVESVIIPNIVDVVNFKFVKEKMKKDNFYFVSTGSLINRKGMNLLIEAFNKAFKDIAKVKLYIYGEGPERRNLEKMIHKYKLSERVFLMGQVDRKEIAIKMNESDCFVLASRLETFGVVYIEAMAMGLPVIATKCGGPEDFITEKNGVLVAVDDVNALTDKLITMYRNVEFYNKKQISDLAKETFAPQSIANLLIEVYENLINKKIKGNE